MIANLPKTPRWIQPAQRQRPWGSNPIGLLWDQRVPMRDGVLLSTDVYVPVGAGPFTSSILLSLRFVRAVSLGSR